MHKSRLVAFVIDAPTDVGAAADFWSQALGRPIKTDKPLYDNYRELATDDDEPVLLVQKVDHPARIHLDIETDDMEAEVERLEALGARRVGFVRGRWWVMEAPTGHRFCVVNPQRGPLGDDANQWP